MTDPAHRPAPPPVQVSFEFFPPKSAEMEATLWKAVQRLAPLAPRCPILRCPIPRRAWLASVKPVAL